MSDHLSDQQLSTFAVGLMEPEPLRAMAEHLAACEACAARLQKEAQLETLFHDAARARPRLGQKLPFRARGLALVAVAIAAGLAAVMLVPTPAHPRTSIVPPGGQLTDRGVVCAEGPRRDDCVKTARQRGLYVNDPATRGATQFGLEEF